VPATPWRSFGTAEDNEAYLVLASRLPLRSYLTVPRFLVLSARIARQLEGTSGLVGYSLLAQPLHKTFWTLSVWRGQAALEAFVETMPHQGVMRKLRPRMRPTTFTSWAVTGAALPISWDEAIERLTVTDGGVYR